MTINRSNEYIHSFFKLKNKNRSFCGVKAFTLKLKIMLDLLKKIASIFGTFYLKKGVSQN